MLAVCQALTSGSVSQGSDPPRGLSVLCEGFSLHAGVFVSALDGDALERLARLCAPASFAPALGAGSRRPDPVPRQARGPRRSAVVAPVADAVYGTVGRAGSPAALPFDALPWHLRPKQQA